MAGRNHTVSDSSVRPGATGFAVDPGIDAIAEERSEVSDCEDPDRITVDRDDIVVKKLLDPKLPSQAEVDKHSAMGHIPYRSWCPICVKAQGRDSDHQKDKGKERKLPEYSWDYCFPGNELGFKWTVLVGKERQSKSFMATTVPEKGRSGQFSVDKIMDFIDELGDTNRDIIVKADQENAMGHLLKVLVQERDVGKTICEESPVQSSSSNGIVERGIQESEGRICAICLNL